MKYKLIFAAISLVFPSCLVDLTLDNTTAIACGADNVCPSGWRCREDVGRCLPTSNVDLDITPPLILNVTWSKATASYRAGEHIALSFETSEPIHAPTVRFASTPARQFTCSEMAQNAFHCIDDLALDPSNTAEGIGSVLLLVRDLSANETSESLTTTIDYTPPSVEYGGAISIAPLQESLFASLFAAGAATLATVGSRLAVSLAGNEPLATEPTVWATLRRSLTSEELQGLVAAQCCDAAELADAPEFYFTLGNASSQMLHFAMSVDATVHDGCYCAQVELQDTAGNTAAASIASVGVAAGPLAPPDVGHASKITLWRQPWANPTEPIWVHGESAAVQPHSWVVALRDSSAEPNNVLAFAQADAAGAFTLPAGPIDRPVVFLLSLDQAGNESLAVPTQNGRWRASLDGKIRGSMFGNPHRLLNTSTIPEHPTSNHYFEATQESIEAVAQNNGLLARVDGFVQWRQMPVSHNPGFRAFAAMAFDSRRDLLVLFGGLQGQGIARDTWLWSSSQAWRQAAVGQVSPSARMAHSMTYDRLRDRVLVHGGVTGFEMTPADDFWLWDGASWEQPIVTVAPPSRAFAAMVFDPQSQKTVLFGGCLPPACETMDPSTWLWDGLAWQELATENVPPPRLGHAMAYSRERGSVVLFGGCVPDGVEQLCAAPYNDTWEFRNGDWHAIATATQPSARPLPAMAYHHHEDALLLMGSPNSSLPDCHLPSCTDCLWAFRDGDWQAMPYGPQDVTQAMLVERSTLGTVLTYGGVSSCLDSDDHETMRVQTGPREWRDGRMQGLTPSTISPELRVDAAMVFDAHRQRSVLFGGQRFQCDETFSTCGLEPPNAETWEWHGAGWVMASGTGVARYGHSMVYDPTRQQVINFGGRGLGGAYLIELETWQGTSWMPLIADGAEPAPRAAAAVAYDAHRDKLVVFGGTTEVDSYDHTTWEFDLSTQAWSQRCDGVPASDTCAAEPTGRASAAMVYDVDRAVTLLFGGWSGSSQYENDLWEWDGAAWSVRESLGLTPEARALAAMVYDSSRQRIVLHGGEGLHQDGNADATFVDTWEWDGFEWRIITPDFGATVQPFGHAMSIDHDGKALLVGGSSKMGPTLGTWQLNTSSHQKPSLMLEVDWRSAAVPATWVTRVEIDAIAKGQGYAVENAIASSENPPIWNFEILVWNWLTGRFTTAAMSSNAAAHTLQAVNAQLSGEAAQQTLSATPSYLLIAVQPMAGHGNGNSQARIDVESAWVTVHYRASE